MLTRQFSAASARSLALIRTRINFSASAKVAAVTSGPTPFAVPNTGGEPDGRLPSGAPRLAMRLVAPCEAPALAASNAADDAKNSRRDFDMVLPSRATFVIVCAQGWLNHRMPSNPTSGGIPVTYTHECRGN